MSVLTTPGMFLKFGGTILVVGIIMYPIAINPMRDSSRWKEMQSVTRKGINQEDVQPVGLKVWSDPFKRD